MSDYAKCRARSPARAATVLGALVGALLASGSLSAQQSEGETGGSGLKIPRYVSLKSDRVNLRQGPGTEYPIAWVFRRAGLPVEVIREFEGWREIRDADGTTGWVLAAMLSGRRTAVILPWEKSGDAKGGGKEEGKGKEERKSEEETAAATLRYDDSERSRPVAQVEAGVLASIISCDGRWCRVSIGAFRGYIEQKKLWGAYQGEVIN